MVTIFRYRFFFLLLFATAAVLTLLFPGCDNDASAESRSLTFVGGEIVNPKAKYLVLKRNGKVVDTINLGSNNKFSYAIQNAETGIYVIKHPPETENIYIYPGDSLLIRVNTLAFDESIHFSGIGSERNNFMKQMFLQDEKNTDLILSYYKIHPEVFEKKADSIYEERLRQLETARQKRQFPDDFVELAQKVIKYESYDLRERYLYLVHKYYKSYLKEIPETFTKYRDSVDFNDEMLQTNPAYRRFIENYLINYSLKWCATSSIDDDDCSSLTNNNNILYRIEKAADLLETPRLRNYFLTKLGVLGVAMANKEEEMVAVLNLLKKLNYPDSDLRDLRQMAAIQVAYLPGTSLQEAPVLNIKGEEVKLKTIVYKPTIVFLWSLYSRNHEKDHQLIRNLRKKYPEISFVGVNVDVGETQEWQKVVRDNGYNSQQEFQLDQTQIKKRLFQYYLNKLLFLDSSGRVIIGDAFINSPELEGRILEFLNR